MAFKYAALKGRIIEMFGSQGKFAEAIGISEVTVSKKLHGKSEFSKHDIELWAGVLHIPSDEIGRYFFT